MGLFSGILESLQEEAQQRHLIAVDNLHRGYAQLIKGDKTDQEIVDTLNNALKVIDGLKKLHNSRDCAYNQPNENNFTTMVYYDKRSNTIKNC